MNIDLYFVGFDELCVGVDVVDILVPQGYSVAPVQRADVVINCRSHGLPVMLYCETRQWRSSVVSKKFMLLCMCKYVKI